MDTANRSSLFFVQEYQMSNSGNHGLSRLTGANTIVLCVHGIQGSPRQFQWLVECLPEQVDYTCVLLPGHGETTREFRSIGARDWIEYVVDCYRKLCAKYDRVIYVGHSMGCLLGIIAAKETGSSQPMLFLACPLSLHPTVRYFSNNLKAVGQGNDSDPYVSAAREANSVISKHAWSYLLCLKPYWGLLRLIHAAKTALRQIPDLRAVLVHSQADEIVSAKSLLFFANLPNATSYNLPGCGHFYYSREGRHQIKDMLLNLIK